MKATIEFNLNPASNNNDIYLYNIVKQAKGMYDVIEALSGKYGGGPDMNNFQFKHLNKWGGIEEKVNKAEAQLKSEGLEINPLNVATIIMDDFEDAFYGALRQCNVSFVDDSDEVF